MIRIWYKLAIAAVVILLALFAAACSAGSGTNEQPGDAGEAPSQAESPAGQQSGEPAPEETENREPVTLTVLTSMSEGQFNSTISEPLKAVYPHITLQQIVPKNANNILPDVREQVVTGELPDIIMSVQGVLNELQKMEVLADLTPLIEESGFDTGIIEPTVLEAAKLLSGDGKMTIMPYSLQYQVLYYNKEIFDRFGVAYPADGMTWDSMKDVIAKVSRTDSGIAYRGLDFQHPSIILNNQRSLGFVDPETMTAAVNNEEWKLWFDTISSLYHIQGNALNEEMLNKSVDAFLKDQTLAMTLNGNIFSQLESAEADGFQWDMVSMPVFSDLPGIGMMMNAPYVAITATSEKKEAAFEFVQFMLSEEMQLEGAKAGRMPVIINDGIQDIFGSDIPVLQGKNMAALFQNKTAAPAPTSEFDTASRGVLAGKFKEVALGKLDTNTALKQAEDEINALIKQQQ